MIREKFSKRHFLHLITGYVEVICFLKVIWKAGSTTEQSYRNSLGLPASPFLGTQGFVWGCCGMSPARLALSSPVEAAEIPLHHPVWEGGSSGWGSRVGKHRGDHSVNSPPALPWWEQPVGLWKDGCAHKSECLIEVTRWWPLHMGWVHFLTVSWSKTYIPRKQHSGEKVCFGTSLKHLCPDILRSPAISTGQTLYLFWLIKKGRPHPPLIVKFLRKGGSKIIVVCENKILLFCEISLQNGQIWAHFLKEG